MQEDFLHYIWKHKRFDVPNLRTTVDELISIVSVGQPNQNAGPDFFNAQLKIGDQLWAGNVEVHVKSSDWFLHNHEQDRAYDNVILHVVWEHDTDIFRKNNSVIPTLELKTFVSKAAIHNYEKLFSKSDRWINCENEFYNVDDFLISNWLERLYFERLERKTNDINKLLEASKNDWEAVLFKMLAKNFGLKVNGEAFLGMANSFDFSIVRKCQSSPMSLEALFFGQAKLLEEDIEDAYYKKILAEFEYLTHKFKLKSNPNAPIQFFRLRPSNFPTIRLSQFAALYHKQQNLFSKVIETNTLNGLYDLFQVSANIFWDTHYTFNTVSKSSKKILTKSFVDLLLINTIIPLKFCYAKFQNKDIDTSILQIVQNIDSETNSILEKFNSLKLVSKSALQSQSLLQLKNDYCDKNKCLQCAIGSSILKSN